MASHVFIGVLLLHSVSGMTEILLLDKTVTQSSTRNGAVPQRAIDGNTDGVASRGSCTHTYKNQGAWWMVDLVSNECIGTVAIYNRHDCCEYRLIGAVIRIGPNPDRNNAECGSPITSDQVNDNQKVEVTCNLRGRYLSISLPETQFLTLCEVKTYCGNCAPPQVTGLHVTPKSNTLNVQWDPDPSHCSAAIKYVVTYELRNWDQCQEQQNSTLKEAGVISSTQFAIVYLYYYSDYLIHVRARYENTLEGKTSSILATTEQTRPSSPPANVSAVYVTSKNVTLEWHKPPCGTRHGQIVYYYYHLLSGEKAIDGASTSFLTVTFTNLSPFTNYTFGVAAVTSLVGPYLQMSFVTKQAAPSAPPSNISIIEVKSETITLKWSAPPADLRNGDILYYSYVFNDEIGLTTIADSTTSTEVTLTGLSPFSNYTFQVAAATSGGTGPLSKITLVATKQAAPSAPLILTVADVNRQSITVTWQEPMYPNGIIEKYLIQRKTIAKPYDSAFASDSEAEINIFIVDAKQRNYTIVDLKPSTTYEINVTAYSGGGMGESSFIQQFTLAATITDLSTPTKLPQINNNQITSTTVGITIPQGDSEFITGYQVGVRLKQNTKKREAFQFGHHSDSPNAYIAAELPEEYVTNNPTFIIGDGMEYGMFHNEPLNEGETYTLYTAYISRIDSSTYGASWSEGTDVTLPVIAVLPTWMIPVICIIVIMLVLSVVVIVVVRRKRRSPKVQENNDNEAVIFQNKAETTNETEGEENNTYIGLGQPRPSLPTSSPKPTSTPCLSRNAGPIKLDIFENYAREKKQSYENSFNTDFETLPGDNLHPWIAAKKPENKKKNRYANITTYDNARVVLHPLKGDPHSDYINASFIDGMYSDNKYIASQGPNAASVDDFWRMIWQYNVRKIIMLTNLVESGKVKCEKYWPDVQTVMGGVTIIPKSEDEFADYAIRSFYIEQASSGEVRELKQYHFHTWPDMGVPQCPSVLNFMKLVNNCEPEDFGPDVIHCSAGVGRTGTYIAIDSMIEQGKREGAVDVYGFVSKMRNSRMKMVQTSAQYRFIFDTLLEQIYCGDTAMLKSSFQPEFKQLTKIDPQSGKSGLQKQFEALEKVTVWPHEDMCHGGKNPINATKNRFPDIIPTDQSRPYLMTEVAQNSTNYVNATYIDSFQKLNQHIVTQMPLADTVADIWRLAYDYEYYSIVMLNTLDSKDPSMAKYWPAKGETATFGPLSVTNIEEDHSFRDVTVRTLHLSHKRYQDDGERIIRQFALENWSAENEEPKSTDSVLALIRYLKQWQKQSTHQRVIVHCIDGVGASCAFIAVMSVLEQLEYNDSVDIFQAVRRLRLTRPQAVRNLVQYTFCYKTIQTHLSSFGIYENLNLPEDEQRISSPTTETDSDIYANIGN